MLRSIFRRRLTLRLTVLGGVVMGAFMAAFIASSFFSASPAAEANTVLAGVIPKGNTPTAAPSPNPNSATVSITFPTVSVGSVEIQSYTVKRYTGNTGTSTVLSCPAPSAGVVTCTDTPGDGTWRYSDTGTYNSWSGAESDESTLVTVDTTAPTVAVSYPVNGAAYNGAGWTGTITGTSSDATSGVGSVQVSVQQGSGTNSCWTGTGAVFTAHCPNYLPTGGTTASWTKAFPSTDFSGDGSYTVLALATDNATNTSTATSTFTYDNTAPTTTLTFPAAGPYNAASWNAGASSKITGTASDATSGINTVQVSVEKGAGNYWNGTDFTSASEQKIGATVIGTTSASWSLAFAASNFATAGGGDGSYTVRVYSTDQAGNAQTATTSQTFTYDNTAPTASIVKAAAQADPTNALPINFTVTFSKVVTGFSSVGLTLGGTSTGTKTAVVTGSGTTYNVAVSGATGTGTVTAQVNGGSATDAAGNGNTVSGTATVTYDITPPTASIVKAAAQADPTNALPINFTVTFSKVVTGFSSVGLTLGGTSTGTKTAVVTGSGTTYNVAVSGATGTGTVTAQVNGGSATDAAGNGNTVSGTATVTYDITPPTASIVKAAAQADPTNALPINFTVTFSKVVTGFSSVGLTLGGTSTGTKTAVVTGSGTTYNVAVSGATGTGTVTAQVNGGSATDAAGNGNTVSGTATVTYDITPPTASIVKAAAQADPTNALPINFTVTFSKVVTGFSSVGLTLGGTSTGTKTAVVTGSGTTYNVAVSGATGTGTVTAQVNAGSATDAAGNGNTVSGTATVTYDITPPTVTNASSTLPNGAYRVGQLVPVTVMFSKAVTVSTSGGTPTLALNTTPARSASYASGSGTATLTFNYTVQATDTSARLDYASTSSLSLNGGTIQDAATNNATLTLVSPGTAQSLGANKNIVIDTTPPTDVFSLTNPTGAFINVGAGTIFYKGNATGSFALHNAPTDGGSGVASVTFGSFVGLSSGFTYTGGGRTVSGTSGDSNTISWTSATTAPTVTAFSTDNANNASTGTTFTLTDDTTAPTGAIATSGTSGPISLTSSSVTDGTGSGPQSVAYYWCNTTCTGTPLTAPSNWHLIGTSTSPTTWPVSWDSTTVQNGSYTLKAVLTDNVGNQGPSSNSASVIVANSYSFAVANPGTQTAGTAFGGFTIQLRANGVNATTFNGAAYTGSKTITFTGTGTAPDGTHTPIYPATVSFTNGLATLPASVITLFKAETPTLTATDSANSIAGASTSFTVNPSTPASETKTPAADNQSATVNTAFAVALSVTVKDSFANPVPGITVTFGAPTGAVASGAFTAVGCTGNPPTTTCGVTTNAGGVATATTFTANATAGGPYSVSAAASGGTNPSVNFSLTNNAAATLTITGGARMGNSGNATFHGTGASGSSPVTIRVCATNTFPTCTTITNGTDTTIASPPSSWTTLGTASNPFTSGTTYYAQATQGSNTSAVFPFTFPSSNGGTF